MSKQLEPSEPTRDTALRMIHNGRLQMGLERQGDHPSQWDVFYGIKEANRIKFPDISPLELSTLAASLVEHCPNLKEATKRAADLIREAQATIERERQSDLRTDGLTEHNEKNRGMWRVVEQKVRAESGTKTFRERTDPDGIHAPFPINSAELFKFVGVGKSSVYGFIDKWLNDQALLAEPDSTESERKDLVAKAKKRGFYSPMILQMARDWKPLEEALKNCREKAIKS